MEGDDENFGINPAWIYRKTAPETRRILGLKPTQIDEEIAKGNLEPPLELTAAGKARGWLGATLIKIQRERLARATAKQRALPKREKTFITPPREERQNEKPTGALARLVKREAEARHRRAKIGAAARAAKKKDGET